VAYLALLLLIGFFFKSFIFINGESTLLYYVLQLLGAVIVILFNYKKKFYFPRSLKILLFLLVFLALERSTSETAYIFLYVLSLLLYFVVLPQLAFDEDNALKLLVRFGILIYVISLLTLLMPHIGFDNADGRYRGFFVSVAYACNFFPFFTILFLYGDNGLSKKTSILLVILGSIFTFITFSKGSIVLLLASFLYFSFNSKSLSKPFKYMIVLLVFIFFLVIKGYSDRFIRHDISDEGLFGNRTLNWLVASDAIANNFILGKSFIFKYTEGGTTMIQASSSESHSSSSYNQAYDPHSMFLLWMVQGGILYTVLMLYILFSPFYFLWKLDLFNVIDFYIFVNLIFMLLVGGDFSSFGNHFEKIILFFIGYAHYRIYSRKKILNESYY
jgi:hypothetical protein